MHFHFRFLFIAEVSVKTLRRHLVLDFLREKDRTGVLKISLALVSMYSSESLPGFCTHSYSVSLPPSTLFSNKPIHHRFYTTPHLNLISVSLCFSSHFPSCKRTPIHSLSVSESVSQQCRFVPFILIGNHTKRLSYRQLFLSLVP